MDVLVIQSMSETRLEILRMSVASVSLMKLTVTSTLDYHIDTLLIENFRSLELNLEFYEMYLMNRKMLYTIYAAKL